MPEDRLHVLLRSQGYWTARAMREQGSRFFRALGEALDAADATNKRRIYEAWTNEVWDFYERGLRLEAAEREGGEG
ncbi:hypothetical protein [Deinococcus hopiensis]|uniref:Uncharacterized protein n=1 Tax=Deinococcus hopiensis KR-140 TaxID=695939 RepID=A0A1W1VFX9_9DEIO|nr:hypothetical protein [Deinococcus hopiensis]SMB92309.1 hypothetical protein SAMN00790413_01517 [Deinococcus hopiensis KR-140]